MDATARRCCDQDGPKAARTAARTPRWQTVLHKTFSPITRSLLLGLLPLAVACSDSNGPGGSTVTLAALGTGSGGEHTHELHQITTAPATRLDADGELREVYAPKVSRDAAVLALAFPTGQLESSQVLLHQVAPRVADRHQPYVLEYHVTNLTAGTLDEVAVHLHEVDNLELLDSTVHPGLTEDTVYWSLGRLGPNQTRVVRLSARSPSNGPAASVATVTYRNTLRSQTFVVEAELDLVRAAPAQVARDEVFELHYTLANTGSGTARRVTVQEQLPAGLTTLNGDREIQLPVLALGPGQTERRTVRVRAERLGSWTSAAQAVGTPELLARSTASAIEVLEPSLTVEVLPVDGAGPIADNETTPVTIRVRNTSPVRASSIRLELPLARARLLQAPSLALDTGSSLILGHEALAPGAHIDFTLHVASLDAAPRLATLTVSADHTEPASAVLPLAPLPGDRVALGLPAASAR